MMTISFVAMIAFACLLASMDCKIAAAVHQTSILSNMNNLKYDITATVSAAARPMPRSLLVRGGSRVIHSTDAQAFDQTLQQASDKLVCVDFSASWCAPCKMIAPLYDEMSALEENNDVVFIKVDVDEVPEIAERYQVMSMPTFLFLKKGELVDRFSGASIEKLRQTVAALR